MTDQQQRDQQQQQTYRAVGSLPEGVDPAVWDELERAQDKYGRGPNGEVDRTVVIKPGRPKSTIDNVATVLEMDHRLSLIHI